jgi:hypothetical protein
MNPNRLLRALLILSVPCLALTAVAKDTEVDVVVDFTPAGRELVHPTPGNPVYFYPVLGQFQELGSVVAGEVHPKPEVVAHTVAVELAKQGYLEMKPTPFVNKDGQVTYKDGTVVAVPANPTPGHPLELNAPGGIPLTVAMLNSPDGPYSLKAGAQSPANEALHATDPVHGPVLNGLPTLVLSIQMGCMNPLNVSASSAPTGPQATGNMIGASAIQNQGLLQPGDAGNASTTSGPGESTVNGSQMLGLLAGNTLNNSTDSTKRDELMAKAAQNRYFLVVNAYDYDAYHKSQKLVLLWQAKMSSPSDKVDRFQNVLDALVAAGGPFFGREMTASKEFDFPMTPDGRVEIGALEVKDQSDAPMGK